MKKLKNYLKKTIWLVIILVLITAIFHGITRFEERVVVREIGEYSGDSKLSDASEFSIGIYNIAHGRGDGSELVNDTGETEEQRSARLVAINQLVAEKAPTFMILNECDFDTYWSHNMFQAGIIGNNFYQYAITQSNYKARLWWRKWDFGNTILTNIKPTKTELIKFEPLNKSELIVGNHDGLLAHFEDSKGRKIRLLAVHLEVRSEATRVMATKRILEIQQQESSPLFVAGDFNSTAKGMPGHLAGENGKSAIDLLLESGAFKSAVPLAQLHPTFPSRKPSSRIDWILIPSHYKTKDFEVKNADLSDHGYVRATLVLP